MPKSYKLINKGKEEIALIGSVEAAKEPAIKNTSKTVNKQPTKQSEPK